MLHRHPAAALVAALLRYASATSGLPIPPGSPAPDVRISPARVLGHYAYGDHEPWAGMTDTVTGRIELHRGWNARSAEDRCILAHELTHFLQVRNGQHFNPEAGAEPAAYRVTALCFAGYHLPADEVRWAWGQVAKFSAEAGWRFDPELRLVIRDG